VESGVWQSLFGDFGEERGFRVNRKGQDPKNQQRAPSEFISLRRHKGSVAYFTTLRRTNFFRLPLRGVVTLMSCAAVPFSTTVTEAGYRSRADGDGRDGGPVGEVGADLHGLGGGRGFRGVAAFEGQDDVGGVDRPGGDDCSQGYDRAAACQPLSTALPPTQGFPAWTDCLASNAASALARKVTARNLLFAEGS